MFAGFKPRCTIPPACAPLARDELDPPLAGHVLHGNEVRAAVRGDVVDVDCVGVVQRVLRVGPAARSGGTTYVRARIQKTISVLLAHYDMALR
jgi:hypothetical protein